MSKEMEWQPVQIGKRFGQEQHASGDVIPVSHCIGQIVRVRKVADNGKRWKCKPSFIVQVHPEDFERLLGRIGDEWLLCDHMILAD